MKVLVLLALLLCHTQAQTTVEELVRKGHQRFSEGRFGEARAALEQAVKAQPNSFEARLFLGATLVELQETDAAIQQLRRAVALHPKHADARKLLAAQLVTAQRFAEAVVVLQPPTDEESHLLLIEARQAAGDSSGAFQTARQAAARFPKSAQIAAWLGFQLQFAGRYQEARTALQRAIVLDENFAVSYQLLGEVYLKEENYPEAVLWLGRAKERMPDDLDTLLSLARALVEGGSVREAQTILEAAARLRPAEARVHLQLSRLYFRIGDEARAKEEAALSIKLREVNPPVEESPAGLRMRVR